LVRPASLLDRSLLRKDKRPTRTERKKGIETKPFVLSLFLSLSLSLSLSLKMKNCFNFALSRLFLRSFDGGGQKIAERRELIVNERLLIYD
jgi:hypothetical protein